MKPTIHICPICNALLEKDSIFELDNDIEDYYCRLNDDHFYGKRIGIGSVKDCSDNILNIKVRFTDENDNDLYLSVNFDKQISEVWSEPDSKNKVQIDQMIIPDFSNIDKIKQKIKTCLTFS